ncbi:TPA: IS21 family transposase [Bacillus cereus]|uniref:IS21 family transposase n=1 Tax=Bacillus cereus group sp. FL70 TaxID=3040254 RepID=UPI0032FC5CF1|nr:IS21 family transposase [Bacillus cereus]HDR8117537.1 IS21 family transposase [Bacillus cereus]
MLAMPEINYIKHLRENEDLTITEISRKLGCNWRTAKKYADGDIEIGSLPKIKTGMMYEEVYVEIVDCWLTEDTKLKKKQRRTAKKMFEQLRNEHEFKGSYRTVCNYVQDRKLDLKIEKTTRYERLEHPPGEAQVDYGNMKVVKDGAYKDVKVLYLSFPHSNAAFACPLPAENTEYFLEGLKTLFHQVGGVPTVLRIDNLSAAVATIGKGENRKYTDSFLAFQAQYGFEIQACNPYSGHEKGNVEKKVGYIRNNVFLPEPVMENFKQLTSWLENKMKEDRNGIHYEKGILIDELWKEDEKKLKALPEKDVSIYEITQSTVNKYGEITLDNQKIYIPNVQINKVVVIKKEWDTFICVDKDGEVIFEGFRPYMNQSTPIPWESIFDDWITKPRAVKYSRHVKHLPEKVQQYLLYSNAEVKNRLKGLKDILQKGYTLDEVSSVLNDESRYERDPHELRYLMDAHKLSTTGANNEYTPSVLVDYETDLSNYNKLLGQAVSS